MFYTLLSIALAPGIAIILFIYFMDKYEREPKWLLAMSFLYGICSIGVTLVLSYGMNWLVPEIGHSLIDPLLHAFLEVSLVEESSKFLFLIFLIYPRKDFNEPFDGIVYAVMIGMGFATVENILYSFQYGLDVALMRMFSSVPAHGVFAVLMGYFVGLAKFGNHKFPYLFTALIAATLFHGLYDYFLFISHIEGMIMGSIIALIIGIYLSKKAINSHSDASPFKRTLPRQ